jgi:CRP-like cAMP-binding protein
MAWTDRLTALRALPGWLELPATDLGLLASIATPRSAQAGEVVIEQGRPLHSLLVVVDGELAVSRHGERHRVAPRDVVGAVAGFARDPAGVSCVSIGNSSFLELPLDDLEDVLEDRLPLLTRWMRSVARELLRRAPEPARYIGQPGPRVAPPFDLVDRIALLRRTELLRGARVDGLASFARTAREVELPVAEPLWRRGIDADYIALVVDGRIGWQDPGGYGYSLRSGEFVGVHETFAEEPRRFDVFAEEPTTLLVLDRDAMVDVWEDHPDVGIEMLRALSRELLCHPDSLP